MDKNESAEKMRPNLEKKSLQLFKALNTSGTGLLTPGELLKGVGRAHAKCFSWDRATLEEAFDPKTSVFFERSAAPHYFSKDDFVLYLLACNDLLAEGWETAYQKAKAKFTSPTTTASVGTTAGTQLPKVTGGTATNSALPQGGTGPNNSKTKNANALRNLHMGGSSTGALRSSRRSPAAGNNATTGALVSNNSKKDLKEQVVVVPAGSELTQVTHAVLKECFGVSPKPNTDKESEQDLETSDVNPTPPKQVLSPAEKQDALEGQVFQMTQQVQESESLSGGRDQDLLYAGVRKVIEETQSSLKSTINMVQNAQGHLVNARRASQEMEENWSDFQDRFEQVNNFLVYNIARNVKDGQTANELKQKMIVKQMQIEEKLEHRKNAAGSSTDCAQSSSAGSKTSKPPSVAEDLSRGPLQNLLANSAFGKNNSSSQKNEDLLVDSQHRYRKRRTDEICPVFEIATNRHAKDSVAAMGDIASMRQQFTRFGSNGIQTSEGKDLLICAEAAPSVGTTTSTGAVKSTSAARRASQSSGGQGALTPLDAKIQESSIAKLEKALGVNVERDFPKLPPIRSGDWLKEHSEVGQTFKSFMSRATSMNARPSKTRKVLYVQPMGAVEFAGLPGSTKRTRKTSPRKADSGASSKKVGDEEDISTSPTKIKSLPSTLQNISELEKQQLLQNLQKIASPQTPFLKNMKSFLEAFFLGMDVKILPYQAIPDVTSRNNEWDEGQHQLDAGEIISKHLPKLRMPLRDSYALLGVTMEDLYPRESWNFVFGLADMLGRNGVFSFARYDDPLQDELSVGSGKKADEEAVIYRQARLLKRAVKVMAHELGHCFGLKHCVHFNCLMQGSNSGEEAERKPHFLCPVCLKKLYFSVEFDAESRYKALMEWVEDVVAQQKTPLEKQVYGAVFGGWQDWYARRLGSIAAAEWS